MTLGFNLLATTVSGSIFQYKNTSIIADIKVIIVGVRNNLGDIDDFSSSSVVAWSQTNRNWGGAKSAKKVIKLESCWLDEKFVKWRWNFHDTGLPNSITTVSGSQDVFASYPGPTTSKRSIV